MRSSDLSLRQLFVFLLAGFIALFIISAASAWTGPTAAPPNNNAAAPINVGTTDQVKNAGIGVNSLAVFGNTLLGGTSDSNAYENFGGTSGDSGYGIRDDNGTMEYKDASGNWSPFNTSTTASSSSSTTGGLVGIQTFTSSGTWTKPDGVDSIAVYVTGGGGGGGGYAPYNGNGSTGGSSSFGSYVSATGGGGGQGQSSYAPITANGGQGINGDLDLFGGNGSIGSAQESGGYLVGGNGGNSYWGEGAVPFDTAHICFSIAAAQAYGAGGLGTACGDVGNSAAGGGAGGTAIKVFSTPPASVSVTVGAGGAGGSGSGGAGAGGSGAPGVVVIYEYK